MTGERPSGDGAARRDVALEQEIRFCDVDGARVAYALVGSGPALVLPALWIGHLELEWGIGEFRAFIGALARRRTVIRYDRLGTGLSDRPADAVEPTLEAEVRTVAALVESLGIEEVSLLGISWGSCTAAAFAARHAERVRCVALVGAYAHGEQIAPGPLRDAMVATVRAHWGAGSRLLADVWVPGADADTRERFARLQRAAADPEVAATMLEAVYRTDIRDVLPRVGVPALVVHRREDRAMPFAQGREVAALLPQARLVALDGDLHPPWLGDSDAVLGALTAFLDTQHSARATPAASDGPLSEREREVLQLVADGLSDPRDRPAPGGLAAHGAPARRQHPHEAAPALARRRRGLRRARGPDLNREGAPAIASRRHRQAARRGAEWVRSHRNEIRRRGVHDRHPVAGRLERRDLLAHRGEPQSLRPTGGRVGRDRRDDDHVRGGAAREHVGVGRRSQCTVDAAAAGDRDRWQQDRTARDAATARSARTPAAASSTIRSPHSASIATTRSAGGQPPPGSRRAIAATWTSSPPGERSIASRQRAPARGSGVAAVLPGARKRRERRRRVGRRAERGVCRGGDDLVGVGARIGAGGEPGRDQRPRRRPHDHRRVAEIHAAVGQPGKGPDLPGDRTLATAPEHDGRDHGCGSVTQA